MQIGQKIQRLDTVDSTNNYTANLLKEGKIEHGAVILADEQTAGRGQRGATWTSEAGENMLLSALVFPDNLSVENQVALTHFASVSIVEVLRKIGISAEVKWPNDIYVKGKKIAGILIENTIKGDKIYNSIIGIGLNVNQKEFQQINATSVFEEIKVFKQVNEILFLLLDSLNKNWLFIQNNDLLSLRNAYLNKLYLLNKKAQFEDDHGQFEGVIIGITANGLLRIQKGQEEAQYDLKEIRFISQNAL